MKAMLSQPMNGKTDEEIKATREKAIKALEEKGYSFVSLLSLWRTCPCVMQHISAKAGKMQEDAESNMMRRLHMD